LHTISHVWLPITISVHPGFSSELNSLLKPSHDHPIEHIIRQHQPAFLIPDPTRLGPNGYRPPSYPRPAPGPAVIGVVKLRSVLSTLPNSRWYRFEPETRLLVLKELWGSF